MDGISEHHSQPLPDAHALDDGNVHLFPNTDPAFRAAVLAAIERLTDGSPPTAEQVEEALRQDYPAVRVVRQTPFGGFEKQPLVVYVFRDGSVQPQPGDGPGTPRYIPLIVAVQREAVRSISVRQRSAHLLARAVEASERSRASRQRPSAP